MSDYSVTERNENFKKGLEEILDDLFIESLVESPGTRKAVRDLAIEKIVLLRTQYERDLLHAIADKIHNC